MPPEKYILCNIFINLFIKLKLVSLWKLITEVVLRILISTIYQQEILLFLYTVTQQGNNLSKSA